MEKYRDIDNDSGVAKYEIGSDFIVIEFEDHSMYEYSYQSAGQWNIEKMKRLAKSGDGLNAFIIKNVRNKYSRKIR